MRDLDIDNYSSEIIGYHCYLLHNAGLIEAIDLGGGNDTTPYYRPKNLTWEGHEFIENAANENIWAQAKEVVSKVGDASFSIWASVLTTLVTKNLGL